MDPYIYRLIRFIVLLICLIPSLICFLLVFFFLCKSGEISRKRLHNHVILVLLFSNFLLITTELPFTLIYSYYGHIIPQTDAFCSFWVAYNYGLYAVGLFLMAFGSIERYFLIFHERFIRKWSFIIHYPPIFLCFVYPLMFYNIMANVYPCENMYYYEAYVCGGACFQFEPIPGTTDYMINVVTPTICIIIGSMILLFRVTHQKRAMKIANTWRRNRLLYIQLISISMLYFLIWIPFVTISIIRIFHDPYFLQDVILLIINYCLYICPLASPFISLIGLPVVRRRIRESFSCMPWINHNGQNRVRPTGTVGTRAITRQQHQQLCMSHPQNEEHTF